MMPSPLRLRQPTDPGRALLVAEALNQLVRPCLAITFGAAIVYMAIVGAITSGEFLGIAAVVVGFFFQSRQTEKAQEQLNAKQDELVDLAARLPPDATAAKP